MDVKTYKYDNVTSLKDSETNVVNSISFNSLKQKSNNVFQDNVHIHMSNSQTIGFCLFINQIR